MVASEVYTFVVGPNRQEFNVYGDAVAVLSESLHSLVKNDSFIEAKSKRVIWDDVDVETFMRFLQYSYSGDYEECDNKLDRGAREEDAEESQADLQSDQADEAERLADDIGTVWREFARSSPGKGRSYKCVSCQTIFYESEMNNGCPRCPSQFYSRHYANEPQQIFKPVVSDGEISFKPETPKVAEEELMSFPWDDTASKKRSQTIRQAALSGKAGNGAADKKTSVLRLTSGDRPVTESWDAIMADADVYVLADRYMVEKLKNLVVQKIQLRMNAVEVDGEGALALLELARFVYLNTSNAQDRLRGLVTHFMVAEVFSANLGGCKGFSQLLADIPEFAVAFWGISYRMRTV